MADSKDLFDDSTMTFGEHLECLRIHLIRAVICLLICIIVALFYGDSIVAIVRAPIDSALRDHGHNVKVIDNVTTDEPFDFAKWVKGQFGIETDSTSGDTPEVAVDEPPAEPSNVELDTSGVSDQPTRTIEILVRPSDIANLMHQADPDTYPKVTPPEDEQPALLPVASTVFLQLQSDIKQVINRQNQAVTLTVQEAFLTYIKVSAIAGLIVASPYVFYQAWLFVAAGLYPTERKYVYTYLPMSIVLFVGGAIFCFFAVFPFVLQFLLGFNAMLEVQPQIRLSEWISFAVTLPLMFGISFQLPMIMLFLERISVFGVADYREKRRMAILVIAFLSMIMTPADPMSMLMMMIPLTLLYEFGIFLCVFRPSRPANDLEPV